MRSRWRGLLLLLLQCRVADGLVSDCHLAEAAHSVGIVGIFVWMCLLGLLAIGAPIVRARDVSATINAKLVDAPYRTSASLAPRTMPRTTNGSILETTRDRIMAGFDLLMVHDEFSLTPNRQEHHTRVHVHRWRSTATCVPRNRTPDPTTENTCCGVVLVLVVQVASDGG